MLIEGSPTEPGEQGDVTLGLPGPVEPMPIDEEQREEATLVNEDEQEGEADGYPQA